MTKSFCDYCGREVDSLAPKGFYLNGEYQRMQYCSVICKVFYQRDLKAKRKAVMSPNANDLRKDVFNTLSRNHEAKIEGNA